MTQTLRLLALATAALLTACAAPRHDGQWSDPSFASRTLRDLFGVYVERPGEMRPWYQQWVGEVGRERAACDYLAGMTDRFAEQVHARLFP